MLINGERALAYIVTVDELIPLVGYDKVEYARTNGWWCVVSKTYELKVGDKCVYFEIDSQVPSDDERFRFLGNKKYKIKAQRMCKVISQGLLLPLQMFPEIQSFPVGTDVTKELRIIYATPEDNIRKQGNLNPNSKYQSMKDRHPKIFQNKYIKRLMKREFGRQLLFFIFGRKKDKPLDFPSFIKKTDEERIENQPWRVNDGKAYIITEKLDGTSCTYVLRRHKRKFEFMVCSRNRRLSLDNSIYWELAKTYHIEDRLKDFLLAHPDDDWVCIQGEGVGSVQGNPLKLFDNDLYVFNLITSTNGRYGTLSGKKIIDDMGMKWVPIIGLGSTQATMEEIKKFADGMSYVNPACKREGLVYRSLDGSDSFKNVSQEYLLSRKG